MNISEMIGETSVIEMAMLPWINIETLIRIYYTKFQSISYQVSTWNCPGIFVDKTPSQILGEQKKSQVSIKEILYDKKNTVKSSKRYRQPSARYNKFRHENKSVKRFHC